jgi:uncharacterized protein
VSGLPIITCDDCSCCCLEQCSPPGYVAIPSGGWSDEEDIARYHAMPQALRDELNAYGELLKAGKPHPNNDVCIWLDEETRRCRHYEHRPQICRDFAAGSPACVRWRETYDWPDPRGCRPTST